MHNPEKAIFRDLVEHASDTMGNAGCNDFDLRDYMNKEEINAFVKAYYDWNGSPEEFEPGRDNSYILPDFAILSFLLDRLVG